MGINTIFTTTTTTNQFLNRNATNDLLVDTKSLMKASDKIISNASINSSDDKSCNNHLNDHEFSASDSDESNNNNEKRKANIVDGTKNGNDDKGDGVVIKCSAVHTLERDMPTFDYSRLVDELRARIIEECELNQGIYPQSDIEKCKKDDWHISRFLLRHKLDVDLAFEMLKKTMRFHHESLFSYIRPEDFPAEFYLVAGLFGYEPDRKGNKMLYIRAKIHRKIPEIQAVLQTFLYYNINSVDKQAGGKGMSLVIDCSGAGIANADMEMVMFLLTILMNYFPKGLSYILVHELPWILKPFWLIARAWVPEEHRELIKFSNSRTIFEYVDKENLPDYMGGTCERDYRVAPDNCTTLKQAAKLYGIETEVVRRTLMKFVDYLPPKYLEKLDNLEQQQEDLDLGFVDRA